MVREERVLSIVDLENACGGSGLVSRHHAKVRQIVNQLHTASPQLVVCSTGTRALEMCPNLLWEWGTARYLIGHGLDGADNALIRVLREEPIALRSTRVFLVSGDHAFAEPVAELRTRGIPTTVVANPRRLSKQLAQEADQIRWLPDLDDFIQRCDTTEQFGFRGAA